MISTTATRRLLALLAALALGATACGGGDDDAGGAATTADGDDATSLQLLLFGGPEEVKGYNAMADAFMQEHDGIDVTVTPVPTQDELLAKLTTSFTGGQPPDVFLINFRKFGQFAEQDLIEPVQPFLDDSDTLAEDDFVDPPLEAFRFDGENLTCQPQNVSNLVVYYNEDLFEQRGVTLPPGPDEDWTWQEFVDTAAALTGPGEDGAQVYGLGTATSIIRVAPFVWSNGGEVTDDPEQPTRLTLTEGPAREALDFFLDLSLEHGVVPPDVEEQSEDAQSRFLRGGLGMYLNSRKVVPTLRTIEDFTWDVAPLPVAPGGSEVTMLHSDAYCISAGTGNESQAWELIEFAMSRRGQEILAESGRTVPSRIDVLESEAFLRPDLPPANSQVYANNARIARATPNTATWLRVETAADDILESIFYGRIPRDEGIRRLHEETDPLFEGAP